MLARRATDQVGSVYDPQTQLVGNFRIWEDGYANTVYKDAVKPLSDDRADWAREAKLEWGLKEAPCYFEVGSGTPDEMFHPVHTRKILYRDDSLDPVAVVGTKYKAVQPAAILEFFGKVADKYGMKLELAGEAMNGRRIFGMARCPQEMELPGADKIANYLMLVTHNDGTGASRCFFTTVRFFCMNQLPLMLSGTGIGTHRQGQVARQTHSTEFDVSGMTQQLKHIDKHWAQFEQALVAMRQTKLTETAALKYMAKVFGKVDDNGNVLDIDALRGDRTLTNVMLTYKSGDGQEDIRGTVFGALNGVTRYLDHDTGARTAGARIERSWLGAGRKIKEAAYGLALELL